MKKHSQHASVAKFIADKLEKSGRAPSDVAIQCGLRNPDMLAMISAGTAKVPFQRIDDLAVALGADPAHLLRLVAVEYLPEAWEAIERNLATTVLTANELELVRAYRQVTGDSDATPVVIDRNAVLAIVVA